MIKFTIYFFGVKLLGTIGINLIIKFKIKERKKVGYIANVNLAGLNLGGLQALT